MKSIPCFICTKKIWNDFLRTPDFSLQKCATCGLIRTVKIGTFELNDDQYTDPDEPRKQFETKRHIYEPAAKNVLAVLTPYISSPKGKRFLDIGCGLGWALKEAKQQGYSAYGIDTSQTFISGGKKFLKVKSDVADFRSFRSKEEFDVILLSHVVEHIDDLPAFLKKVRTFLQPNGLLLIACPNIDSLMFTLYKERWYALAPGQHLWQFTPKTLSAVLEQNGFTVKNIVANNLYHEATGIRNLILHLILWVAPIVHKGDQIVCVAQMDGSL
jgi:2-polyprenyl-3-methyl-5-hydroxy-6-metoxy-1,4-benzoquinol methylase